MDTKRWKSILVPIEMYHDVRDTARKEGRTISGQLCYAYDQFNEVKRRRQKQKEKRLQEYVDNFDDES